MTLIISLKGRLRNKNLPKSQAQFSLYESFQTLDTEYKKSLILECITGKRRITENMITEVS